MQAVQSLGSKRARPDGLRRTMLMSLVIHLGAAVVLFAIPGDWLRREEPKRVSMSLQAGSPGEKTGGMTAAGARPIEEVAPPPKRPAPIPPVAPAKAPAIAVPVKPPPKTAPRPVETSTTSTAPPRPPTTGAQKTVGTSAAETLAAGQSGGLSLGGGSGLQSLDTNFCCPEYGEELRRRLWEKWQQVQQSQQESGTNIVSFVIRRDGTFADPEIVQPSGSPMLDIASRFMLRGLKFPPLPDKYKEDTLTVRLKLEYKR